MKKIKTISIATLMMVSLLSGCAISTISSDEVKKYKGSTLQSFLEARFFKKSYESSGLMDGNGLIYRAPFTRMNDNFLYRPYNELSAFCRVNNGVLEQIVEYNHNPIKAFIKNPYQEYYKHYSAIKNKGYSDRLAHTIAKNQKIKAVQQNAWLGLNADGRVLEKAVKKNKIFGSFECNSNGKAIWSINMIPIRFSPRNPKNQLDPASLYIGIGIL